MEDRISLLPEEILHHILCFLSQKEAIQTCVLSKPWRYLGCTRPKIDFGFITSDNSAILERTLQAYHDRNLRLDEFSIWLAEYYVDRGLVDKALVLMSKWIPIIIQNMRVKSFDFYLDSESGPQVEMPSLIFESHHIQKLYLSGCTFEFESSLSAIRVGLKHMRILELHSVYIPEEILDKVLSVSCPFIEKVSISNCEGFTRIRLLSYNPTNLSHFSFTGLGDDDNNVSIEIGNGIQTLKSIQLTNCLLSVSHPELILSDSIPCNLTKLNLCGVDIPEQILGEVLSNFTFIENVSIVYCKGFARIKLLKNDNPTNITEFRLRGFGGGDVSIIEIGNDMQALRTIEIEGCLFSVSCNKPLECVSLTRLILTRVRLVSSESFSCNLHSLEELKLDHCSGIEELKLSSRSMKRLSIHNNSKPFRVTVDAPSIVSFIYEGILPQSISFAGPTTSSDELWKSEINLGASSYDDDDDDDDDDDEPPHCLNELYGLLKAVSQSEISLELDQVEIRWFHSQLGIGDNGVSEEAKHELPVAVEHLRIQRSYYEHVHSSADPFLNMLFRMFRPSFVYLIDSNKKHAREIEELLFKKRGTKQCYTWQRVLEGVSLQVKYRNGSEWQAVEYTSLSFTELCNKCAMGDLNLRIHLKWRD